MRALCPVIVLLTVLAAPTPTAQVSIPSTAPTLRGVVTTTNNVPLARVRVAVADAPYRGYPSVLTDQRGQFTLRVPESATVHVNFNKAGFAAAAVDLHRSGLEAGTPVERQVRMLPGGVIRGRVRDRSGAPVSRSSVYARAKNQKPAVAEHSLRVTTNDLGEYRIGGLAPDTYTLEAHPSTTLADGSIIDVTYFPGRTQTVRVGPGKEVSAIDFTIEPYSRADRPDPNASPVDPNVAGSIRGRVVTIQGVPIPRAVVEANRDGNGEARSSPVNRTRVEANARGEFVIAGLAPGDYTMSAFKDGFFRPRVKPPQNADEVARLSKEAAGRVVSVRTGQTSDAGALALTRGAAITGKVVDEFGQPMQGVAVNVVELRVIAGEMHAVRTMTAGYGPLARTDDLGQYRVFGLQPGTYVIEAGTSDVLPGQQEYSPLFNPGIATLDQARSTKVDGEAVATNVDVVLRPRRVHRLRGTVVGPSGQPTPALIRLRRNDRSGPIPAEPFAVLNAEDGTFTFDSVPEGDYAVQAISLGRSTALATRDPSGQLTTAFVSITGDDPPPLSLKLFEGVTLSGRIAYEGAAATPFVESRPQIKAIPDVRGFESNWPGEPAGFTLRPDNTFEYRGVAGRNFLTVRSPDSRFYVKSITYNGKDLTDVRFDFGTTGTVRDIEIVLAAGGATLTGQVLDDRATPVGDYDVAVFSADPSKWTMRSRWVRKSFALGLGFRVTGLPPGEYFVAAIRRSIENDLAGDLHSYLLEKLMSRAVRVTVGAGQSQNVTVRLVRF